MKSYGALNLAFAALYAWFGFVFTPGRSTAFNLALAVVCLALAAGGIGLLLDAPWGRLAAKLACWLLVGFAAVVLVLLIVSAAILRGIYGPLGQGMSIMTLLVAALVLEAFALLPLFELRALARRGR